MSWIYLTLPLLGERSAQRRRRWNSRVRGYGSQPMLCLETSRQISPHPGEAIAARTSPRGEVRFGVLLLGLVIMLSACKADSTRDILDVAGSTPALQEALSKDMQGGVPQPLSGILRASDIDFGSYSRDLAKFVKLEIGEPMASAESKTLAYFTPKASGEGNVQFEMDKLQGYIGGQAFIATIDGLVDDSVKAEQLYAIGKKQVDENYTLVDYGMRVKCWRGENPNEWGTDLCP